MLFRSRDDLVQSGLILLAHEQHTLGRLGRRQGVEGGIVHPIDIDTGVAHPLLEHVTLGALDEALMENREPDADSGIQSLPCTAESLNEDESLPLSLSPDRKSSQQRGPALAQPHVGCDLSIWNTLET